MRYADKYYKLSADIVMNKEISFHPIAENGSAWDATNGKPFIGTFDGDGHTISKLKIDTSTGSGFTVWATGLFATAGNGATIKNFLLKDSTLTGESPVGGIIGIANIGVTVENIYVDSDVTIDNAQGDGAGGIIGQLTSGKASGDGESVIVRNCVNAATVKASMVHDSGNQGSHVGGIIGNGNGKKMNVSNCLNIGTISATYRYASGIVGREDLAGALVEYCVNLGSVECENTPETYARAIINSNSSSKKPLVNNCYYLTGTATRNATETRVATLEVGELYGTDAAMKDSLTDWTVRDKDIMIPTGVAAFAPQSSYYDTIDPSEGPGGPGMEPATAFASGTGTEADPFIINTAAELLYFSKATETDDFAGKYIKLGANITLNEGNAAEWGVQQNVPANKLTSIGKVKSFAGTFDGAGHTISGIYVKENSDCGLFSNLTGATVKNFALVNSFFWATKGGWIGAVAGGVQGANTMIQNIYVDAVVKSDGDVAGGIIGGCSGSDTFTLTVENCAFAGKVIMGETRTDAGGIVGSGNSSKGNQHNLTIKNCLYIGSIECNKVAGGILGVNNAPGLTTVANCISAGSSVGDVGFPYGQSKDNPIMISNSYSNDYNETLITDGENETYKHSYFKFGDMLLTNGVTFIGAATDIYGANAALSGALTGWTARENDVMVPTALKDFAPQSAYYNTPSTIVLKEAPAITKPTDDNPKDDKDPVVVDDPVTDPTPVEEEKGCGSMISAGSAMAILLSLGLCIITFSKRKKERI